MDSVFYFYMPPIALLAIAFFMVSRYNRRLANLGIESIDILSDKRRLVRAAIYAIPAVILTILYWQIMEQHYPYHVQSGTFSGLMAGVAIWHILYYWIDVRPIVVEEERICNIHR